MFQPGHDRAVPMDHWIPSSGSHGRRHPRVVPEPGDMSGPTAAGPNAASGEAVPFARFVRYFLGLGTWGFGGPIATVGYMQRDLVEQRAWVSRRDFLDGVALGQTMPGPLAAQVAMWVGYLQAGAVGALGTAVPFILPSLAMVLAVSYLYVRF